MLYRALVSFSGSISMAMGEIRELTDKSIVKDLLKAGYIEEYKAMNEPKPEAKKSRKKGESK